MKLFRLCLLSITFFLPSTAYAWLEAPQDNFIITVINKSDMYVKWGFWGRKDGHKSDNNYTTAIIAPGASGTISLSKGLQFKTMKTWYYGDAEGKQPLDGYTKDSTLEWPFNDRYTAPEYPRTVYVYGTKNKSLQQLLTDADQNGVQYPSRWYAVWSGDIDVKAIASADAAVTDTGVKKKCRCFRPDDKNLSANGAQNAVIEF